MKEICNMKKKVIIIGSIVIAAAAVFFLGRAYVNGAQKKSEMTTAVLAKSDLIDSVLASGTVISSNSKDIYSTLPNYTIKEVSVKVGDKVKAGDVLAVLDTASLESDIKQSELNIRNAETTLKNDDTANQSGLQSAGNNVELAAIELENAQRNYDKVKGLVETGAGTPDELKQAEAALKKASLSYDNAQITLKSNQSKSTSISKTNIEIQKVTLEKLKKSLRDAKITSPVDGTVTLANAKAGESSTGLLFIVEDTENLIVSTSIGEYDISLIKLGQEVTIKSDSTGDMEFPGTISKIAPAAKRDGSGNISTSNVQYETEVAMKSNDSNIRIGMNVRLTIKLNEKKDVFAVPYEAVATGGDGTKYISVLETADQEGKQVETVKKIKVETGMETDMSVEIQAPELTDGLKVITNPQNGSETENQGANQ